MIRANFSIHSKFFEEMEESSFYMKHVEVNPSFTTCTFSNEQNETKTIFN